MNMMSSINVVTADPVKPDATWRMGQMLWSAIQHGCLLDRSCWPAWITGVQNAISIDGATLAVELVTIDSDGVAQPVRRWFADPITKVLIAQWRRERLILSDDISPERCLMAFEGGSSPGAGLSFQARLDRAHEYWEVRLPGLMLAQAKGELPSASLPTATWNQIVYCPGRDVVPLPELAFAKERGRFDKRLDVFRDEFRALRTPAPPYRARRAAAVGRKQAAAKALQALPPSSSPIHQALRAWCVWALVSERGGRVSRGYAPRTVAQYLGSLAGMFVDWPGGSPVEAAASVVAAHIEDNLDALTGPSLERAIKAVLSFQRYRRRERPDEPLAVDLTRFDREARSMPNVILPGTLAAMVGRLDRGGDGDLARMATLMFRAGLRADEVAALRIGDLNISPGRVELVVEGHDHRPLKTKTSRRIIPLDVLLEPDELDRLTSHVAERLGASAFGIEALLFGRASSVAPPSWQPIERVLCAALRRATGMQDITTHHLRHSFASYLLATLLLPVDVERPDIPTRLAPVISRARRDRVSARLLGHERMGGGALHAVSQVLGHTGPRTTVHWYCHLLDLSLGIYCSRASSLARIDHEFLITTVGVSEDSARRAAARVKLPPPPTSKNYRTPSGDTIRFWTPDMRRRAADATLLESGFQRIARPIARDLAAAHDEAGSIAEAAAYKGRIKEAERAERDGQPAPLQQKRVRTKRTVVADQRGYAVPWREIMAVVNVKPSTFVGTPDEPDRAMGWRSAALWAEPPKHAGKARLLVPPTDELAQLVDDRLCLDRRPRRREVIALQEISARWRRGRTDIVLHRLADAEAFVTLLVAMGFTKAEIVLSLTSVRGLRMSSADVHRFLQDRSVAPGLAGRVGWRGSLVVRLKPAGVDAPILGARACRLALMLLAIDLTSR